MLFWLFDHLSRHYHTLSVFQYITLRALLSALTALLISLFIGPHFIRRLTAAQKKQIIRQEGPLSHFKKAGTPTMGGSLILIAITVTVLLWGDLTNRYLWLTLFVTLTFGLIGWYDDHLKVKYQSSQGLPARYKFLSQSFIAILVAVYLFFLRRPEGLFLVIPFVKENIFDLGLLFIPFTYFVIVGTSNAVNLTDGLDGLAILPTVMIGAALGVFTYVAGNYYFATYLYIPFVSGAGEVTIFCGAIAGAGLGFLWYNTYPAQVFMGDVGALGLGAALAVIAVIIRQELALCIMGGVFVVETLSVILQVASFKLTGKRIFKMAPLHHHFELKGWPEPRVIVRFWIITLILVLVGLMTLKLR